VKRSLGLTATLLVAMTLFIAPAAAQATLVFTRNPLQPVVFAANDDGSGAHRIGSGSNPRVSSDGQTVAFYRLGDSSKSSELLVAPTAGGPVRKLASGWQDPFVFAWSPDSTTIAILLGPELGKQRLTTIDVASGEQHTIATGYFGGVSFAPEGDALVYARSNKEFGTKSDVYRFVIPDPGTVFVRAPQPERLTSDHRSSSPLWGPDGTIAFVKHLGEKRRRYGPKNDLFSMDSGGDHVRRLTNTKVGPLLSGLSPTAWSANGKHLLAEFGGQDTSYAVTVNPKTGAERALTREREVGFVGTAISRNGKSVLGSLGGFEPGRGHKVVSIPYAGGKPTVLAKNASEPDWSR
jgi:Tol biopolymer transport system component